MGKHPVQNVPCPYCGKETEIVTGDRVYYNLSTRPDLREKLFFKCFPCDAYVGCHEQTGEPLGTPAKSKLRRLRSRVHKEFDPLWKKDSPTKIFKRRGEGYKWLADHLGVSRDDAHIGNFDEDQCHYVLDLLHGQITL